jgi:hypothetical protein
VEGEERERGWDEDGFIPVPVAPLTLLLSQDYLSGELRLLHPCVPEPGYRWHLSGSQFTPLCKGDGTVVIAETQAHGQAKRGLVLLEARARVVSL